ncbi:helix-turn-helix domain-containing protein [uncultured Pseudonocardia sp.]|uniref:helix-turn-helix domain-containing protein n=2 Tax=Pseudonocardia TaxID=1847 RepID=UPI00262B25EC|nr:helix-turn-helix domain-containing protein [uncultured Pseudonocardia sp.]
MVSNYRWRIMELLTTGQLARELGVSRGAVVKWAREGKIQPELSTPGGHHRWKLDDVRAQLRRLREDGGG